LSTPVWFASIVEATIVMLSFHLGCCFSRAHEQGITHM
jgi:hypothetical protein